MIKKKREGLFYLTQAETVQHNTNPSLFTDMVTTHSPNNGKLLAMDGQKLAGMLSVAYTHVHINTTSNRHKGLRTGLAVTPCAGGDGSYSSESEYNGMPVNEKGTDSADSGYNSERTKIRIPTCL